MNENIVFSSSATVYCLNEKSPLNESSKLLPVDPYGKTKLTVENNSKDYYVIQMLYGK